MNKCLVTKLKGIVNNDNLMKVGEYKMHINLSQNAPDVKFLGSDGTITILGNNNYYFTKNGQQAKTINYSEYAIWPAGEYDVLFTNKYALRGCDSAQGIDLEIFTFCDSLSFIGTSGNVSGDITFLKGKSIANGFTLGGLANYAVTGHLSDITSAVTNKSITISSSSIVGDIALLGNTGSNKISVVHSPHITGSLEGLVAALVSDPINPFTSGSKDVRIAGSGVTINGQVNNVSDEVLNLIMEDATHWYYPSRNNSLIDNSSYNVTIYAKNPKEEQITAWEANNNTVVVLN